MFAPNSSSVPFATPVALPQTQPLLLAAPAHRDSLTTGQSNLLSTWGLGEDMDFSL